jgi:cytochrome c oxidase subunit 4
MTTNTANSAHQEQHGMSDAGYIRIAIILATITGLEVSTYYVDFGVLFLPALLIMMAIKIFSFLFYAGLILAVGVYAAFLATFKFFIQ